MSFVYFNETQNNFQYSELCLSKSKNFKNVEIHSVRNEGGGVGVRGLPPPPPPKKIIAQDPGICAFQGDTGWVP